MAVTLLVTGPDLVPLVQPIATWTSISADVKRNEVGGGEFTAPADSELMAAVATPGARVRLIRDGYVFSAGPVEVPAEYEWTASGGDGLVTVRWADDLVLVARRLAYPDPAVDAESQVLDSYEVTATNAETIIRDLVDRNVGPGALTARVEPLLTLAAAAGVGTDIDTTVRFALLGDTLRGIATAGGGLGFRVVEAAGGLVFSVFAPADRSATVRFSEGLNNLRKLKITHEAPAATVAIVGGQGTGAARTIVERISATAATWGRSEQWTSNQESTTTTGLEQAGDAALAAAGEHYLVAAEAVDTPQQRLGPDFWLGDTVSLAAGHGIEITDVVVAAKLTATPETGDQVTVQIGSQWIAGQDRQALYLRDLERRIGALERS